MSRTSTALRRLSVPVLASSLLVAGLGGIAHAAPPPAAPNGQLQITSTPTNAANDGTGYGSATPQTNIQHTVTYYPGTQAPPAPQTQSTQTIHITVSGSATIVAPTTASGTLTIAGGGKSADCVTAAAAPNQVCNFAVTDTLSEAVTVTASETAGVVTNDATTPSTSVTDNFAAISFAGCPTIPNSAANCGTQQAFGATQPYTVTYLEGGAPAANRAVVFSLSGTDAVFPTTQPAGSTETLPQLAQCTTDAAGKCTVSVAVNNAPASASTNLTATTNNTQPYPASTAVEKITFVPTSTAGRLVQTGSKRITPTPTTPTAGVNEPGYVVQNTYTLSNCAANTTTGFNACTAGNTLAGQTVALSVDHGFFTPNCKDALNNTSYAACSFNATPAAGQKVGDLKSLGATTTVTTDANGAFTVSLGIARDAALDQYGDLIATVTGTVGGVTLTESTAGHTSTTPAFTCATVGQSGAANAPGATANGNDGAPQAGCAAGTPWTTKAAPLNGASVKIVSVTAAGQTDLSDSSTNNVQSTKTDSTATGPQTNPSTRVFVLHLTDQFGNLTSGTTGPATSGVTLTKTGVGDLQQCGGYSASADCTGVNGVGTSSTDATGATTTSFTNVPGSYLSTLTPGGAATTQTRFVATSALHGSTTQPQTGTQTLKATWTAPVTTFNTFSAGPPAVATYATSTATLTDTVVINYYTPNAQPVVKFATTPGNTVPKGSSVTVSATVSDQFGTPIKGLNVQFLRGGPNESSCTPSYPNGYVVQTNANGQAGYSFTCGDAGTSSVTIIVTDQSGNELARGVQNVTFTGGTPGGTSDKPSISISTTAINVGRSAVVTVTGKAGDTFTLFALTRPGTVYQAVRSGTFPASGSYSTAITPRGNTRLFARTAAGDSGTVAVSVRPAMSLRGAASGKTGSFSGTIVPGHGNVAVRIFTVKNGALTLIGSTRTLSDGHYSFSRTFAAKGAVTFIAQTLSDGQNLSTQSNRVTVTFK